MGWIELFYDLVYVATIIQLGDALAKHPNRGGFVLFAVLFTAVWYAWTGFTFYSNRFEVDDALHRLLVFVQMFGIAAMAVLAANVFEGETQSFALAYVLVRAILVAFYLRARFTADGGRELSGGYTIRFAVGAMFWLASAFVDPPWVWILWAVGLSIELSAPLSRKLRELSQQHPPDAAHMAERYGLLTIIVLGESFVKVLSYLADGHATGWETVGMGGLALVVTCSVWWIYFDDVVHSRIRRKPGARLVWVYSHLPLAVGITALGVGVKKVVAADPGAAMTAARWMFSGSLGLVFIAVAVLDWVTERDESRLDDNARVWIRLTSAAAVLSIAAVGDLMANWICLALIAVLCVAQVLADLIIAPLSTGEMDRESMQASFTLDDPATRLQEKTLTAARQRRDPLEALRHGTPSDLRSGVYFFFMQGGWTRLLSAAAFGYLLLNLLFATLYTLERGNIANADARSFADAFFFSVQTFTTIGFGTLLPATGYANSLVVVEAFFGLMFTAVVTGLVFAKASRPQASVLFSKVATVTDFEGQSSLIVRLGNVRGNELVEASIRLSAVYDQVTEEGKSMRRIRDLDLLRDNQPLFALTWTVVHPIDHHSALADATEGSTSGSLVALIATMTGFDGTYAQTIHARHSWYPEDIRWGEQLVDVLSEREDGRLSIDYTKFHDTIPDHPVG